MEEYKYEEWKDSDCLHKDLVGAFYVDHYDMIVKHKDIVKVMKNSFEGGAFLKIHRRGVNGCTSDLTATHMTKEETLYLIELLKRCL